MAYATTDDFIYRYSEAEAIQLTNSDYPSGSGVVLPVLEQALQDAAFEIDALVQAAGCSFDEPPAVFNLICTDIARYRLYDDAASEEVKARYERALALLDKVISGCNTGSGSGVVVKARKPVLTNSENKRITSDE